MHILCRKIYFNYTLKPQDYRALVRGIPDNCRSGYQMSFVKFLKTLTL